MEDLETLWAEAVILVVVAAAVAVTMVEVNSSCTSEETHLSCHSR